MGSQGVGSLNVVESGKAPKSKAARSNKKRVQSVETRPA